MVQQVSEFRSRLEQAGPAQVRINLEAGHYNAHKAAIAREWLRQIEIAPTVSKRESVNERPSRYKPSKGDMAFMEAQRSVPGPNLFEDAELLRNVSDTYLSVLIADNAGPTSASYKALLDAEMTRRGGLAARRANHIAIASLMTALASVFISVIALFN